MRLQLSAHSNSALLTYVAGVFAITPLLGYARQRYSSINVKKDIIMLSKIIAAEKKTVPPGKRNAGQAYYLLTCFVGSMMRARASQACVFLTGNAVIDAEIQKYWDNVIATKAYPEIDLRYVIVGDREVNPNADPLPAYRVREDDGTVLPGVHTTMKVLVQFEDGKPVDSPRNVAMRIIETRCEKVEMSRVAPEMEEGMPNPLGG